MGLHQRSMCRMAELYRRVTRRRYGGMDRLNQVQIYILTERCSDEIKRELPLMVRGKVGRGATTRDFLSRLQAGQHRVHLSKFSMQ